MKLDGEGHPLFKSLIKDDTLAFKSLISKGLDPFKERIEGVSAYLLAHYLGRKEALEVLSLYAHEKFHLDGWNHLKSPNQDEVLFYPHLSFSTYRLFRKVWIYSQKVKDKLEFKSLWFSKLFKCFPSICFEPPSVLIKYSGPNIGMGLFANEDLSKGSILGEYTGAITKWKFWNIESGDYRFQYPTRGTIKPKYIIDAELGGNWTRLVNHSFDPNIEAVAIFSGGILRMLYVLFKSVKKGEELTIDYGLDYWKNQKPEKI